MGESRTPAFPPSLRRRGLGHRRACQSSARRPVKAPIDPRRCRRGGQAWPFPTASTPPNTSAATGPTRNTRRGRYPAWPDRGLSGELHRPGYRAAHRLEHRYRPARRSSNRGITKIRVRRRAVGVDGARPAERPLRPACQRRPRHARAHRRSSTSAPPSSGTATSLVVPAGNPADVHSWEASPARRSASGSASNYTGVAAGSAPT